MLSSDMWVWYVDDVRYLVTEKCNLPAANVKTMK
jgi:hypothetical protein